MNITSFKSNFQGGARPSLFRVAQNFPLGVGVDAERKMEYMCKGAQLPASNVNPIDVYYMGRQIKVAGDRTFDEMTLTIINDVDFSIRNAFERWMTLENAHESNLGVVNPNMYWQDLWIEQIGKDGSILKTYHVVSAFPTNVSAIDVAFDSTDQVEEFTVTLAYQYWEDVTNGIV
jgi:hypothetical protein